MGTRRKRACPFISTQHDNDTIFLEVRCYTSDSRAYALLFSKKKKSSSMHELRLCAIFWVHEQDFAPRGIRVSRLPTRYYFHFPYPRVGAFLRQNINKTSINRPCAVCVHNLTKSSNISKTKTRSMIRQRVSIKASYAPILKLEEPLISQLRLHSVPRQDHSKTSRGTKSFSEKATASGQT